LISASGPESVLKVMTYIIVAAGQMGTWLHRKMRARRTLLMLSMVQRTTHYESSQLRDIFIPLARHALSLREPTHAAISTLKAADRQPWARRQSRTRSLSARDDSVLSRQRNILGVHQVNHDIQQRILQATTIWRITILLALLGALLLSLPSHSADAPVPPKASFGVSQCGKMVALWIITQDGRIVRMDKLHHPDTEQHQKDLMDWVATGPTDIYVAPCGIST